MAMDYQAANQGLLRGMVVGQGMMRQHQQDQRQAGMDARSMVREETLTAENQKRYDEEKAYRDETRALGREDRSTAQADKAKKLSLEETQRRAAAFALRLQDPKLDAPTLSTILRHDPEHQAFFDDDGSGKSFAGLRQIADGPNKGKYAMDLKMADGSIRPLSETRGTDDAVVLWDDAGLKRLAMANYARAGADPKLFDPKKVEDRKTVEIGAGNGMKTQAVLNADGTTTPIGKPYAQFDPQRNSGGAGGGLPAEAKLIDYYITQHGMSKDAAREEAKRAKDSPRKWAGDHYKALIKLESERLLEEGEVRRSPAELQQQALEDARYFFGEAEKSPAPPLSGMAFAPSLNSRPDYPGGPVPVGSPPGKAQPTAKAAPLPPSGFKPTGKMIKGKPAYVSADGKKFWTH
jgi:hypothetical protein